MSYGKVKQEFWTDEKSSRYSDAGKLLAIYLLTGPHRNSIGCARVPGQYIQADLGWDEPKTKVVLAELETAGFIMRDRDWIMVLNLLRHDPPVNPKAALGASKLSDAVPSGPVFNRLIENLRPILERHNVTLNTRQIQISDQYASPKPIPEPIPIPIPEPAPEPAREEARDAARLIVGDFDSIRVEVFGADAKRPWPHQLDLVEAQRLIAAGADRALCAEVFRARFAAQRASGKAPANSLSYMLPAIREAATHALTAIPEFLDRTANRAAADDALKARVAAAMGD